MKAQVVNLRPQLSAQKEHTELNIIRAKLKKREQGHEKIKENMIGKLTSMPVKYIIRITYNKRRRETFLNKLIYCKEGAYDCFRMP